MTSIINLLGPIVAGIAIAGVLLFMQRVLRIPVPGWLIPVFAAVTIFGLHVSNEYSWYDRHTALLPEEISVIKPSGVSNWYEPWTFIHPRIDRFLALDAGRVRVNPDLPGFVMAPVILVKRYQATLEINQLADCEGKRLADMPANASFGESGMPEGLTWRDTSDDDAVLKALCEAGSKIAA